MDEFKDGGMDELMIWMYGYLDGWWTIMVIVWVEVYETRLDLWMSCVDE